MAIAKKITLGDDTVVQVCLDGSLEITVFHRRGHIDSQVNLEAKDARKLLTFLKKNYEKKAE